MKPCLIPELYSLLVLKSNIVGPCKDFNDSLTGVFNTESSKGFLSCLKSFKNENIEKKETVFIAKIFEKIIGTVTDEKKLKLIQKGEPNFSHYLIWPLMEAVSSQFSFEIGEYKMKAIHKEIARRNDEMLINLS
ncbi:hypothetical protein INT48_001197 [Thamnidium elegans]|uniref:Uncharacterized protein n=1 Tax=Thamnidium elegans TaxID=101142 RepID=A0A8H7SIZ0_9FUNG|nr:hypothetical protein INT48_001197 [Thamnidium elegans]